MVRVHRPKFSFLVLFLSTYWRVLVATIGADVRVQEDGLQSSYPISSELSPRRELHKNNLSRWWQVISHMSRIDSGHTIVAFSIGFFIITSYATLFSVFLPSKDIPVLRTLAEDKHYKYFAILAIPTTFYFVIANWVGWQYYSNS